MIASQPTEPTATPATSLPASGSGGGEAVPLLDPRTGEPLVDPETGEQLTGMVAQQPVPILDPATGEPMIDPETGEALMAIPDVSVTAEPVAQATESISTANEIGDAVSERSETFGGMVQSMQDMSLELGSMSISLWDVFVVFVVIVLVLSFAWLITKGMRKGVRRVTKLDESQRVLLEKILTIVIWVAAFLIGIDMLGIDLTALAVFSGAFGLAIGFGLQKTFGNLISGIILLMDKSIKPGDVISVTDNAGTESFGQIRRIGIRAISVVTRDQTEYLIPNEMLMINQVVNWSYSSKDVRVKAPIGVSYGSDLDLVTELLYQAVDGVPRVLKSPKPRVNIIGFGDSSINFDVRFWIQDPEDGMTNVRSDVFRRIWKLFKENGVEIPFPQRDLNLRNSEQMQQLIEALSQRMGSGEKG